MLFQYDSMPEGGSGGASKSGCPDYWNCVICCTAGRCTRYSSQKKPFGEPKTESRECKVTLAGCINPNCNDRHCELDRWPYNCIKKEGDERIEELWERSIISKQLRIIDRLTQGHEPAKKPIFTLSIIIDKQTFIMPDIQLTLGATPKGPGIFTLTDNVTGGVIATTFSNQQIGANSNSAVATFAFTDATLNTVTGTPLAAGTGTITFATEATYTDSLGSPQTNVQFTQTKNFTVSLGADGVSFDVVFP